LNRISDIKIMECIKCQHCAKFFNVLRIETEKKYSCESCLRFLRQFESHFSKNVEGTDKHKGTPFRKSSKSDNFEQLLEYQINRLMR